MNPALDLAALSAAVLALCFVFRAKKRYFFDTGFFMGIANLGFIVLLLQNTISDVNNIAPIPVVTISLISIMASAIGLASYLVPEGQEQTRPAPKRVLQLITSPPPQFIAYILVLFVWTAMSLSFQPWQLQQLQTSIGPTYYFYYDSWFIGLSTLLLGSFILLPVRSFYGKSARVADAKAARSMKIISICWGLFGVSTFLQTSIAQFSVFLVQTSVSLLNSGLFLLISVALKEPTLLGRIITGNSEMVVATYDRDRSETVVLYNADSDRIPPIIAFAREALANGRDVFCLVGRSDIPFYRAMLKGSLEDAQSSHRDTIIVEAVDSLLSEGWNTGSILNSKLRRDVIDLDELDGERCAKIIATLTSDLPPVDGRVWAVNMDAPGAAILKALVEKNPTIGLVDVVSQQQGFSNFLNMKHEDIIGNRILLEYEPTSSYERVISNFVREFQANGDAVAVFTSVGSPIYRLAVQHRNLRIFGFSTKTSTPAKLSDQTVLLPERDSSLLLDALDKLVRAYSGHRVGIIFDVFTDLILSQGFEKVYSPLSSVVEMSESQNVTTMFLINATAIDNRALNGVRGLFKFQLKLDEAGLEKIVGASTKQASGMDERSSVATEELAGKREISI